MSNEQWNDIWKILKSGQLKFVDNVNSDILCTICKKVLINAHGSPCGCRYCLECITTYLNGEEKICPGNTNLCNEEIININNVLLDHMMNRKISRLIVKCPQEKCKCQDELRNIENHMLICDFRSVDCPYAIMGCNYFDSDLKKHMLNEIVSHTKLIFEYIDNLKNEIKVLKEDKNDLKKYKKDIKKYIQELHLKYENDFENIKVKLNEIEYKSDDKQKSISDWKLKCEDDNKEINERIKELTNKCDEVKKCVNDLQLECDRNDKEIKESKELLKKSEEERKEDAIGMKQEIRMLNEEMETLKKETLENKKLTHNSNIKCDNDIKEIKEKIKELENKCDEVKVNGQNEMKREVKMIKDDLCENKKSISDSKLKCENDNKEIKERIKELTNKCDEVKRFCGREFVWRIDKWTEKRNQYQIDSESFYSHTNGYKMRLSVFPNGINCGEGTHLSVCCCVMRGECDDILPWPFKHDVTFELIDQRTTQIHTSSTVTYGGQYERESGIEYNRDNWKVTSINGYNWICGNYKFVSLEELSSDNDRSLIDNDQIFIRCRVHIIN